VDYPRYDPQSPVTPLTAAELDALDALLQGLPADGVMTLDGVDGYLTALLVGPPALLATLPTAQWLPFVWGGDDAGAAEAAPFASKRQRKNTVVLVLRHLRHLSEQLARSPDEWEPIFSVAEQGAREWVDASDWCAGFLQAVDLLPAAWAGTWDDPVLAPLLAPLLALGGGLEGHAPSGLPANGTGDPDDPVEVDRLSRAVPDAVLQLAARPLPRP
jgi:uncharacterized protein